MTDQAPMTNEVLAVHVDYLRQDVQTLIKGMNNMATKDDVEKISIRMDKFVTTDRFDALEKKVDEGKIGSSLARGALLVQRIAGAVAAVIALFGVVAAIVHYADDFKAVTKQVAK